MDIPQGGSSSPLIPAGILKFKTLVLQRKGKQTTQRKNPWSEDKNQKPTQPTLDTRSWNQAWATVMGGDCSHHHVNANIMLTMSP